MTTSTVHYSSKSAEWLTPRNVLDRVLAMWSQIDLDPCAEIPAPDRVFNVPSLQHYTINDDGLSLPWCGRVYTNPPYSREVAHWVKRLVAEYKRTNTSEAILLVAARPDTAWWQLLRDYYVCFIRGRLHFNGAGPAPFPSAIWYLGPNPDRFAEVFREMGDVYERFV